MAQPSRILVLNGPNLNMLGVREPETYGNATLSDVETLCRETAESLGIEADCRQSNHEGELVQWIQDARTTHIGLVINAGGYSHTSVAIPDAITAASLPTVEVHVSNIYAREAFRHHSTISAVARGVISGLGIQGYGFAIRHLTRFAVKS